MFAARYTSSSRPLQATAQNIAGMIMDGSYNRWSPGWDPLQSYPKLYVQALHHSESESSNSCQSSSSSKTQPEIDRSIDLQELNHNISGSIIPFPPRYTSQPSFTTYSRAFSSHEGTPHVQLRQDALPRALAFNNVLQQSYSLSNPLVRNLYDDQQFQSSQPVFSSSPPFFIPTSPDTSLSVFGFNTPPDLAIRDSDMYDWHTMQRTMPSRTQDNRSLASQQSVPEDFPSPCSLCDDSDTIIHDHNVGQVHYWTKHSPPAGSPEAWTPKKCLWEGCLHENDFKTLKSWLSHVNNVHQKGYSCGVLGCRSKPFGSKADVERHHLTMHTTPKYCTKTGCQARKGINLCRKDKMVHHEAMWHGPFTCEVGDCPRRRIDGENHGFSKRRKLDEHMRKKHPHLQARGP
jgi:hypothetical protein